MRAVDGERWAGSVQDYHDDDDNDDDNHNHNNSNNENYDADNNDNEKMTSKRSMPVLEGARCRMMANAQSRGPDASGRTCPLLAWDVVGGDEKRARESEKRTKRSLASAAG